MTEKQERRALVIVDAQDGFIHKAHNGNLALQRIHDLIAHAGASTIVATTFINQPDSLFCTELGYTKMSGSDPATRLDPTVSKHADAIVPKEGYGLDPETAQHIAEFLTHRGVTSAYIVGFDTDACVLAIAYCLFDAGIMPIIVSDGCASGGGQALHEAALQIAQRNLRVI